jgi:hypothetical protein
MGLPSALLGGCPAQNTGIVYNAESWYRDDTRCQRGQLAPFARAHCLCGQLAPIRLQFCIGARPRALIIMLGGLHPSARIRFHLDHHRD